MTPIRKLPDRPGTYLVSDGKNIQLAQYSDYSLDPRTGRETNGGFFNQTFIGMGRVTEIKFWISPTDAKKILLKNEQSTHS